MKTSKAYYYQVKFKYLEGDKWPVDYCSKCAKIPRGCKCECDERYQEALTSALKEAIDFEDQERIYKIVRESNIKKTDSLWEAKEGLYTIPEIEIKVVNRWIGHNEDSACTEPVARIKESSKSEDKFITLQECKERVARKYNLGRTLVTGHLSKYWEEAAELYASQFSSKSEEETEDSDVVVKPRYVSEKKLKICNGKCEVKSEEDKSAWKDVYMSFNDGEGWIAFTERMSKHFTITRKS